MKIYFAGHSTSQTETYLLSRNKEKEDIYRLLSFFYSIDRNICKKIFSGKYPEAKNKRAKNDSK